jgi:hypothetical protein
MSGTHSAPWGGKTRNGASQCAANVVGGIAMAAWKSRTSQPQNVLHDGGRHAPCQQSAGDPQVHDAPIWVWKSLPYAPALRPGLVDLSGLRGGQARWSSPLPRRGGGLHTGRRCVAAPGDLLATGPLFGVNYFFCLTTIISPDQRQLLLTSSAGAKRHRGAGGAARARLFCSFLRREQERRWESGKPVLGFPLFHPPSRRSCGNVGISPLWARFPRGSWEAWETCFRFSTLSTAPPFPQLSSRWIWLGGQFTPLPLPPGLLPVVSSWPPPLYSSECSVQ